MKRPQPTRARSSPVECTWLLAAAVALACAVGCGNRDLAAPFEAVPGAPTPAAEPAEKTGSLSFALTLQNGVRFGAFNYAITGPNFSGSGSIDVSSSTTVSALIEAIPVASGYSITLMGTSAPPTEATCSGSATFAISAGAVTHVPVALACHLEDQVPPTPVPVPPFAPVVLGIILLAIGSVSARRRGRSV
jgi:hypothetical protein